MAETDATRFGPVLGVNTDVRTVCLFNLVPQRVSRHSARDPGPKQRLRNSAFVPAKTNADRIEELYNQIGQTETPQVIVALRVALRGTGAQEPSEEMRREENQDSSTSSGETDRETRGAAQGVLQSKRPKHTKKRRVKLTQKEVAELPRLIAAAAVGNSREQGSQTLSRRRQGVMGAKKRSGDSTPSRSPDIGKGVTLTTKQLRNRTSRWRMKLCTGRPKAVEHANNEWGRRTTSTALTHKTNNRWRGGRSSSGKQSTSDKLQKKQQRPSTWPTIRLRSTLPVTEVMEAHDRAHQLDEARETSLDALSDDSEDKADS